MYTRDIDALKELMSETYQANDPTLIQKALTVASGFVGINLEPTAKLMLPLYAGLRNRVAVDRPARGGQQAIWRMQLGYGGFDFGANMGTAFQATGGALTGSALTIQANYLSQAVLGQVQFEAIPMAMGYDDPFQIETSRGLATLLRMEELLTLGGNNAALAVPTGLAQAGGSAGSNFAAGNWRITVSAITLQGYLSALTSGSPLGNVVGESNVPAFVTFAATSTNGDSVTVSWNAVPGAVGYRVYTSGAAGGTTLYPADPTTCMRYADRVSVMTLPATNMQVITVTKVTLIAPAPFSAINAPAADNSANANAFEGLIAWAEKSTIYSQALSGGTKIVTDQQGAKLTLAGSGILEIDSILKNFWSNWHLSPTLIVCSAQTVKFLSDLLSTSSNNFMYRVDITQERGKFSGGIYVGAYINKFAASMLGDQNASIPIWAHPYMPDGSLLFLTEKIPYDYSRESRGFALDVLQPYTYFELARTDRSFPFSLFFTETLKCYHPYAQAAIVGARVE